MASEKQDSSKQGPAKPGRHKKVANPEPKDTKFKATFQECHDKYWSLIEEKRRVEDTADTLQQRIQKIEKSLRTLLPFADELKQECHREFLSFGDSRLDDASMDAISQILSGLTAPKLLQVLREVQKDAKDEKDELGPKLANMEVKRDKARTVGDLTGVIEELAKAQTDHVERKKNRISKLREAIKLTKADA